ncbi:MAG: hypothetical protein KC546_02075 [Anaerolineae bacterium]|nr:hypothetical protein [Anaerolineae bacterium]
MRLVMLLLALFGIAPLFAEAQLSDVSACHMSAWNRPIDALADPLYPLRHTTGDDFLLIGLVRDVDSCQPIANAKILFDMANEDGEYDGEQQGTVISNRWGLFAIQSERPGEYGGGPAHIHLFVGTKIHQPLTTAYNFVADERMAFLSIMLTAS